MNESGFASTAPSVDALCAKICVSVGRTSVSACFEALAGLRFAEVRIDTLADAGLEELRAIFALPKRLIATCRAGDMPESRRISFLEAAVVAGARYVDVELEMAAVDRERLVRAARACGCEVIVSHHDYVATPGRAQLDGIVQACFEAGADVAKIACEARDRRDAARLLGLLDDARRLIVIGMGEPGVITRVAAPLLGAELTFAALGEAERTASGQLTATEVERRMRAWCGA